MATTTMDYENANGDRYDEEPPRYERDQRSASPRAMRDDGENGRRRSASPGGPGDRGPKADGGSKGGHLLDEDDDGAINPGSNLFVTGIHPKLTEQEVTRLFEKYGEVEKCQIMRDPHTKESRGFGFVKMVTSTQADAAKEGLQGEQFESRTLSIEKARRARPRTPTPGKYFGPPKREPRRPFNDRYEDSGRRGGGYGGGGRGGGRDDSYRYRGYERRYDDRGGYERGGGSGGGYRDDRGGGYDRSYREDRGGGYDRRDRDDSYGRVDRYGGGGGSGGSGGGGGGGGREDRDRGYGQRAPDERRGPGYERDRGYERPSDRGDAPRREGGSGSAGYGEGAARPEAREPYGGRD